MRFTSLATLIAATALASAPQPALAAGKPNILVILCDDVGWGEFGFQGNDNIPTPHIDSIAAAGVRFTSGYVSGPYCSPTRAGLLPGRYQTRFGHEFNSTARRSGCVMPARETTLTLAAHSTTIGIARIPSVMNCPRSGICSRICTSTTANIT